MPRFLILLLVAASMAPAFGKDPDCSGTENWPTRSALVALTNAGITGKIDWAKTKTTRIASEKIGKDLYRQVHRVSYAQVSGKVVEAITVNEVSSEECSMSGVEVFVVSKHFGEEE